MDYLRSIGSVLVAVTLLAGCSALEDDWRRDRRASNPRCGVDLRYWQNRVEDKFVADKGALVKALNAVPTDGCGKRVKHDLDGLVGEVLIVQR